ncbi:Na+/H+ antiporter subunit E [Devosia sp. RR2S18]|jgi:multicomponent Na+:H+ antiporter subunit E|uniref:Na+/H+ antiporter subunit E n=1 Tax=Devosia rhizosphaerae TaxID=3049774 RepID=UPI00253F89F1|nr:Na+/H+ antiporter subunit E [Devosia sp. RR2S18]WIJ24405.1 Na+/H+ antiporter subunit E [Devosia sp. RR2S18]HEV7290908.1 Na+/H+ antiporter subunit E [Devosia sp.]
MRLALLVIVLALIWTGINGNFSELNLLLGLVIGGLAATLLRNTYARPLFLLRVWRIFRLLMLFLRELVLSAVRVAALVLSPNLHQKLKPAIVAFPLTVRSDAEITLLANMITLTPGTLSIDVSADKHTLYMHVLQLSTREELIADIAGGFEAKIQKVFS